MHTQEALQHSNNPAIQENLDSIGVHGDVGEDPEHLGQNLFLFLAGTHHDLFLELLEYESENVLVNDVVEEVVLSLTSERLQRV